MTAAMPEHASADAGARPRGALARTLAHRADRVPDGGRPLRARRRSCRRWRAPTASRRRRWALPSTPAPSAWRSPVFGVAYFSRRIDRRARHPREPRAARDPDRAPRRRRRISPTSRSARRAGPVHGLRLHADARLSRRALQRHATRPARSRPTSPATSRATSFGRLLAAAVADHLGARGRPSTSSPRSTSPAPRSSISA